MLPKKGARARDRKGWNAATPLTKAGIPRYAANKDPLCPLRYKKKESWNRQRGGKRPKTAQLSEDRVINDLLRRTQTFIDESSASTTSSRASLSQRSERSGHSRRPHTAGQYRRTKSLASHSKKKTKKLEESEALEKEVARQQATITYEDGPASSSTSTNAELDVRILKHILFREDAIKRLKVAVSDLSTCTDLPAETKKLAKAINIIEASRTASLLIVEGIWFWRHKRVVSLLQRRRLPAPGIVHKPYPFVFDGNNYLLKMTSDLRFLDSCEALMRWLGGQFGRNPFCLKKQDALDAVGGMSVMETGLTVEESAQREPPPEDTPFIERLRWASLVILSEEAVYGKFQTKEDGLGRSSGNVKKKKSASSPGPSRKEEARENSKEPDRGKVEKEKIPPTASSPGASPCASPSEPRQPPPKRSGRNTSKENKTDLIKILRRNKELQKQLSELKMEYEALQRYGDQGQSKK